MFSIERNRIAASASVSPRACMANGSTGNPGRSVNRTWLTAYGTTGLDTHITHIEFAKKHQRPKESFA